LDKRYFGLINGGANGLFLRAMLRQSTLTQFAMKDMLRGLTRLSVALMLALVVHALVLWTIGHQMQPTRGRVAAKATPIFTRQITRPFSPTAPKAQSLNPNFVQEQAAKHKDIAQTAIKNEAVKLGEKIPLELPTIPSTPTLTVDSSVGPFTDSLTLQGTWPIDTRLTYDLGGYYRGELLGSATLQWTRDTTEQGEGYQMRIDLDANLVKAQLVSLGRMVDKGLMPQTYEEQWLGNVQSVAIDATGVVLGNGQRIPLPPRELNYLAGTDSVQDTVSQLLELGHRFAQGQARLADGEEVRIWLARPAGLDAWDYSVGPAETVTLPQVGLVQVYPLRPRQGVTARYGSAMGAEIWLAPALQYLPVRIKLTLDNDAYLDLKVQKIEQRY
jgi:hypothetical protein